MLSPSVSAKSVRQVQCKFAVHHSGFTSTNHFQEKNAYFRKLLNEILQTRNNYFTNVYLSWEFTLSFPSSIKYCWAF